MFKIDDNITIRVQCDENQMPRPIKNTDSIMFYMFTNYTPDSFWLTYAIPIEVNKLEIGGS
jgi:hypothetical protein